MFPERNVDPGGKAAFVPTPPNAPEYRPDDNIPAMLGMEIELRIHPWDTENWFEPSTTK
jgi:hypothetical protein